MTNTQARVVQCNSIPVQIPACKHAELVKQDAMYAVRIYGQRLGLTMHANSQIVSGGALSKLYCQLAPDQLKLKLTSIILGTCSAELTTGT